MGKRYEHAGTVNFWKEKKPTFWETVGNVLGGLFLLFIILAVIGANS